MPGAGRASKPEHLQCDSLQHTESFRGTVAHPAGSLNQTGHKCRHQWFALRYLVIGQFGRIAGAVQRALLRRGAACHLGFGGQAARDRLRHVPVADRFESDDGHRGCGYHDQ
jgi:hypothetical protein